jgi:reactive intermediate/imine deaminase
MHCRIARALGVLLAAILVAGCSTTISTKRPNWPVSPGKTPGEVRAEREAEVEKYLVNSPSRRDMPQMVGVMREGAGGKREAKAAVPVDGQKPSQTPQAVIAPPTAPSDAPAASRHGDLLFVSAQLPVDPGGNALPAHAPIEDQARLALENVRAVLETNQLTMANVVSMTVYLTNLMDLAAFDVVAPGFFKFGQPPRSVVGVSQLPRGAKVQVSAVAGR